MKTLDFEIMGAEIISINCKVEVDDNGFIVSITPTEDLLSCILHQAEEKILKDIQEQHQEDPISFAKRIKEESA